MKKVLCINDNWIPAHDVVLPDRPSFGETYTVTKEITIGNKLLYDLAEVASGKLLFYASHFAPLSEIDEMDELQHRQLAITREKCGLV